MDTTEGLVYLEQSEIDHLDLQLWQRKQLSELVKLVKLAVAGAVSIKERDFTDSDLSGADTSSEGGDAVSESEDDVDFGWESVAVKHPGNPEDFQKHMQGFIDTFISHQWIIDAVIEPGHETFEIIGPDCPQGEWTYCMFVWIRFAKEAYFDETSLKLWRECIKTPAQQTLLARLDGCLKQESTKHKLWSHSDRKSKGSKEFSAAIYATHLMVRHHLKGHAESIGIWESEVVKGWFENDEDDSAFLRRANKFLRVHVVEDGIQVVNHVVKTQSYVAFLRMSRLASLMLFEYLEVRKLEDNSSQGPAGSERLPFQGFSMFISSSNRIFSLTVQDVPARRVMPLVRQGLKCLARLPAEAWDLMGPVSTAKDFLSGVAAKPVAGPYHTKLHAAFPPVQFQATAAAVINTRQGLLTRRPRGSSRKYRRANVTSTEEPPKIDEPDWLCCPITNEMFRDPVMVPASGTTYEFSTLEKWWKGKEPRDPLSNVELKSTEVITDWNKRREVDSWLQTHPDYVPSGWDSRDIPPVPKPPRTVTQEAKAGAASSNADLPVFTRKSGIKGAVEREALRVSEMPRVKESRDTSAAAAVAPSDRKHHVEYGIGNARSTKEQDCRLFLSEISERQMEKEYEPNRETERCRLWKEQFKENERHSSETKKQWKEYILLKELAERQEISQRQELAEIQEISQTQLQNNQRGWKKHEELEKLEKEGLRRREMILAGHVALIAVISMVGVAAQRLSVENGSSWQLSCVVSVSISAFLNLSFFAICTLLKHMQLVQESNDTSASTAMCNQTETKKDTRQRQRKIRVPPLPPPAGAPSASLDRALPIRYVARNTRPDDIRPVPIRSALNR
jgi:hypothetical protein